MAEIIVSNKMSSNYSLRGQGELPLLFSVEAGQYEESTFDFDVAIRGEVYNERLFELYVQYGQEDILLFEVQPRINNNLDFEIFVNPHNRMSTVFELLEAPSAIEVFNPIKDTFIASNSPYNVLNYGANNTMKVGYDNYGRNLAYLGFDISSLPENVIINNATVKLYYNMYGNQQLEVYRVLSEWQEYSLTYNNNIENNMLINSSMIVNEDERYIEFDITDLVRDWYLGVPNNGIALLSQSNSISLRSRETATPPKLEIMYYSQLPYLINTSRSLFDLIVRQKTDEEILFNVDIVSYLQKSDTLFEIHAVNRNKLNNGDSTNLFEVEVMEYESFEDILFEIAVQEDSQDDLFFEVEVTTYEEDFELPFELVVIKYDDSEFDFEIEVPEYNSNSDIYFSIGIIDANTSEFGFDVVVSEFDDSNEIQFEIVVQLEQEESILFEAFVNEYFNDSNVLFEISAVAHDKSELIFEVDVNEYSEINDLLFEIDIVGIYTKDESLTLFDVIVPIYSAIYENLFEIEVNPRYDNSQLIFEIAVQDYGNSELNFNISPRLFDISQADFDIEISEKSTNKIYVYLV